MRKLFHLRQGLGYSEDSAVKVLTKFCTPNGSSKKFWPCTKKCFSSQAFQPCMTLWVKNWPKLPKKIILVQESPKSVIFVWHIFPLPDFVK